VFEPRLVLLDEPLGALDRVLRAEMQAEIRRLHRSLGVAMIYVTHDQDEALSLSDRIAVFEGGRMLQVDAPARLFAEPATPSIARFIAQAALLRGRVERDGADHRVRLSDGQVLEGVAADPIPDGAPGVVALRPDQLILTPDGEGRLSARLIDALFHGDHWRISVALSDGVEIVVKRGVEQGAGLPPPGAQVGLALLGPPPRIWIDA
jgi:putative spermidine/putrescine transport system ATP-binding protein